MTTNRNMFLTSKRLKERAEGLEQLNDILKDKNKALIIQCRLVKES
jgi:hypothetical protein